MAVFNSLRSLFVHFGRYKCLERNVLVDLGTVLVSSATDAFLSETQDKEQATRSAEQFSPLLRFSALQGYS